MAATGGRSGDTFRVTIHPVWPRPPTSAIDFEVENGMYQGKRNAVVCADVETGAPADYKTGKKRCHFRSALKRLPDSVLASF